MIIADRAAARRGRDRSLVVDGTLDLRPLRTGVLVIVPPRSAEPPRAATGIDVLTFLIGDGLHRVPRMLAVVQILVAEVLTVSALVDIDDSRTTLVALDVVAVTGTTTSLPLS